MAKSRTKFITAVILITAGVGIVYAWNSIPNAPGLEQGYSQIAAGDSKQKVIEILGNPTEIKDCHRARYSTPREIWEKCVEEYWYIAFMQEWSFIIDKDGKVLAKWHSVSP